MGLDESASMGPRRTIRSGLHATRHQDAKRAAKQSTVDWAAEKPQPVTIRYYVLLLSKNSPAKRAVVVDSHNKNRRVAGPMRCCEAVDKAHELNEQLRPKPKPRGGKGSNKKRHNKK